MDKMTKPVKPRRLGRIVLLGSLALNLMMLGVAGGAYLNGGGGPPRGVNFQLGPMSEALSREDRREIGKQIRRNIGRANPSASDRSAAYDNLIAIVQAEPFDRSALSMAIESQQRRQDALRTTALTAFVEHVAGMTAAQRIEFAERLKASSTRRGDGRRPPPAKGSGG